MQVAVRTVSAPAKSTRSASKPRSAAHVKLFESAVIPDTIDDDVETVIEFPETAEARSTYVSFKSGRPVTEFQYKVYDLCKQIPRGYFTTYKAMSDHLESGPRAVGNALAKNPFCPLPVPCHRVLTSDCYIGGFSGDKKSKIFWKKAKLEKEGLEFDESGFVAAAMQESRFFNSFE
ncbi:DNA binding methylated-DNA--cysteine S-methyltransferase [Martensiomyces pterosporus]|nr:DNA binding methylated-DNA--cysteine S-methyltransferase [Martensiomyces pterosporus]